MKQRYLSGLLFLSSLLFCIASMSAQSLEKKKISGTFRNTNLELALLELEINHRLTFEFASEDISGIKVNVYLPKVPLEEGLRLLLFETGLSYHIQENNTILIQKRNAKIDQDEVAVLTPSDRDPIIFDFNVNGIIKDELTGESLPFATVIVHHTSIGTTSNVDGYFTLFNVPNDTALLEASYLGYNSAYFRLVPGQDADNIKINLRPSGQTLTEINVVANRQEQLIKASSGISQVAINPMKLAAVPSIGQRDIFRSLQLLPGVSGSNESTSGLFVRGGTPDQNLVLFDGFTVYHVDHLFGFFSAFNSNAIKDVQLYKGGFEAKYGGRLSSVVDITGKNGNTEEFNAGVGLSLLSTDAFVEAPFADGRGSIILSGRRSFQSGFYDNLLDFSDGQGNTGTESDGGSETTDDRLSRIFGEVKPLSWFYDLNGKATFRTQKDVFSLSAYGGKDRLDNSRTTNSNQLQNRPNLSQNLNFNLDVQDDSDWGNTGVSFKWSRRWNDKLYSNALVSRSNYFSFRDRGTTTTITRDTVTTFSAGTTEDNDLVDYTAKWDWEWQPSANQKVGFGVFGSYLDIKYSYIQNDTIDILSRDDQGLVAGVYLQDKITINDKLILLPGLRASYFDQTGQTYFEPRFQFQYLATDQIKFKGAIGRYYQFANRIIREDIAQGSRDFWILSGDDNVPVGHSDHFILGLAYETKKWLFDLEGYYKTLGNITEYSTRFTTSGVGPNASLDFSESFFNGTGTARGIEFLIQKKTGPLTGWLSYTLGRVENQFDVFGEDPFPANHDATHETKIVALYKFPNTPITLGGTFIYATGRPYTAPLGAYSVELLDGGNQDYFVISDKNVLRRPDYHRLDVSVTLDLPRFLGGDADVGLSLFNLYGRENVWYKEFEVVEDTVIETDINLLGFTPSLSFNWTLR